MDFKIYLERLNLVLEILTVILVAIKAFKVKLAMAVDGYHYLDRNPQAAGMLGVAPIATQVVKRNILSKFISAWEATESIDLAILALAILMVAVKVWLVLS